MSAINSKPGLSSGVLTILSSSADATTDATSDTESAGAKLIDIAKNATSGTSSSSNPQDTVDLSDDALSYLSSQKSGSSLATGPNSPEAQQFFSAWNHANAGFNPKGLLDQQVAAMGDATLQAAYKSGNYQIVNMNDIQGLDMVDHGDGPMHNTGLVYSTDNTAVQAQFDAQNPHAMALSVVGVGNWYMIPTD